MNIIDWPLEDGANKQQPNRIVVHAMGEFIKDGSKNYFAPEWLAHLGYSAHVLIKPDGQMLRCRYDHQGAYHARGFNKDSLGVEFLVAGYHDYGTFLDAIKKDWVTEWQMQAGIELLNEWVTLYDIPKKRVHRHSDVSPGRKVDPGSGFPWLEFMGAINGNSYD